MPKLRAAAPVIPPDCEISEVTFVCYPEAVAARMIALAWWDWDHARLRAALDDFRALPAEAFVEKHEG